LYFLSGIARTFAYFGENYPLLKRLVFTVTNDLAYDQRMQRIATSLSAHGYTVTLVGRRTKEAPAFSPKAYHTKRLSCWFQKGGFMYAEFNIRLFFWLLFHRMDAICAIDLDTILPCLYASRIKGVKRVYDAHELFTEMKELLRRPRVQRFWKRIERHAVPAFKQGYTVSSSIATALKERYGVQYTVVRNLPLREDPLPAATTAADAIPIFLYQGAVNEARGLENLIPAMRNVPALLWIYGDGNMLEQCRTLIGQHQLTTKVLLKGKVSPEMLKTITPQVFAGINLVEPAGLNQLYSLANKFFDYIQAGIPQVTMNFVEYRRVNEFYPVALLIDDVAETTIAAALNNLIADRVTYQRLKENCLSARIIFCWQQEETVLLDFYQTLFATNS
jgi:glycosyltransferase involved in cell wall biosynthesis